MAGIVRIAAIMVAVIAVIGEFQRVDTGRLTRAQEGEEQDLGAVGIAQRYQLVRW